MKLNEIVNDEQLLDFALSYVAEKNSDDAIHPVAEQIIIVHIMNECSEKSCDEEYIQKRYSELVTEYILASLVKTGLVDYDFESGAYGITHLGKGYVNECTDS